MPICRVTVMADLQAEEAFMLVRGDAYKSSFGYISWLARVLIMNGKPDAAWRLYINLDSKRTADSFSLLHLLANECFGMGQFYHSCKAFQVSCFRWLLLPHAMCLTLFAASGCVLSRRQCCKEHSH